MRNSFLSGFVLFGSALALLACHPVQTHHGFGRMWGRHNLWSRHSDQPVNVASTLDCPDHEGDLDRTSVAADGRSCQYHGDEDQDVTLRLVPLNSQPAQVALLPIETELRSIAPPRVDRPMVNVDAGDEGNDHDHAKVDLPGLHIDANGSKADIDILGAHIKADGDRADINTDVGMKGTSIHAGPGGAEIRAGDVGKNASELVFILAADSPGPSGFRAVGYIARGPTKGPLVVGEFKSRSRRQEDHDRDLERLIDRNVTPAAAGGA